MMPKVLTFCPLPPTITGGIEEYAYSVIENIRAKGYVVIVATAKFKDDEKYPDPKEGYIYVPSFSLWKRPVPKNIFSLFRLIPAIRNADIIHIHMPYPFLESFSAIVAKFFHKNVILTYHADARIDDSSASRKRKLLYSFIEKLYVWLSAAWPLSLSDVICTNTMGYALTSRVLKNYLNKIKIIHQGIKKENYQHLDYSKANAIRSMYVDQGYTHIVTFVGRLVPYKGLAYLIEAISILKKDHPDILFIIGGSGPEKEHLMKLTDSYGLQNVKFIGFVADDTLFNLFAASDVVVSPSISNLESTPISLLCALSTGTAVIGTEVGGTSETVPDDGASGSIIPVCDSKYLAVSIIKMLDMKRAGKVQKQSLRFWSHVAEDYMKLFQTIVTERPSSINTGLVGI